MVEVLILVLISILLGSFGQIFFKKGLTSLGGVNFSDFLGSKFFTIFLQPFVLVGMAMYVSSVFVWFVVLSNSEVSYAYPLIGLSYILTAFIAWFYLKENVTAMRIMGILLILAGAFLVTKS